jgi:uncharacterized protein YkwD
MRISKNKKMVLIVVGAWVAIVVLFMFNVPFFNHEQEQYDFDGTVPMVTPVVTEEPSIIATTTKAPVLKVEVKEVAKPGEVIGTEISADNVFNSVNQVRYAKGLPIYTRNAKLDAAALAKAKDIAEKNYWSHTNPEGKKFSDFISEAGYAYTYAGENLAKDFSTVQQTVDAWIASPTHYENIVKTNYKETGIAVIGTLVVQTFGTEIK